MSRLLLSSIVLSLVLIPIGSASGQNRGRTISVYGYAEKELDPDHYLISIMLKAEGKTMTLANDDFRKQFENVRTIFNEMDFPEIKIVPTGKILANQPPEDEDGMIIVMDVEQETDPAKRNFYIYEQLNLEWKFPQQMRAAEIENGLIAVLDRIKSEKLTLVPIKGEEFSDSGFAAVGRHSNIAQEERALRSAAFDDAKSQAGELAALGGGKVGRVIEIEKQAYALLTEDSNSFRCHLGKKIKLTTGLKVVFELE